MIRTCLLVKWAQAHNMKNKKYLLRGLQLHQQGPFIIGALLQSVSLSCLRVSLTLNELTRGLSTTKGVCQCATRELEGPMGHVGSYLFDIWMVKLIAR